MERIEAEFAPAKESVSWAEDAISEFKAAAARFFQENAADIVTEFDAKTGENVQKMKLRHPIPKGLRRKATEALNNARHSFDQATFAARNLISGHSTKSVYYPWARNPTDFKRLLEGRGIDKRLWDTFAAHEPYPRGNGYAGGDDTLRTLATIANDKHTVGLSVVGQIAMTQFPKIHGKSFQSLNVLNPLWDAVKNEAELVRWIGDVEIHSDYKFAFEIAFKDARLSQPVNTSGGLEAFATKAKTVIEHLERRCRDLGV